MNFPEQPTVIYLFAIFFHISIINRTIQEATKGNGIHIYHNSF